MSQITRPAAVEPADVPMCGVQAPTPRCPALA